MHCVEMEMHSKDSMKKNKHDVDDIQADAELQSPTVKTFKYNVDDI